MASLVTEGLVLKRKNFGEADRVLTVLTNRFGKISIMAKGVRRITSRRAGNIELLNRVKLGLFQGKNYTLTEAESLETFSTIKQNLALTTAAFHIIELVDRLVPESQKNDQIYDLTVAILRILENNPRQIFVRAYEVKLLTVLGFWSGSAIQDLQIDVKSLLEKLQYQSWKDIDQLDISKNEAEALEGLLRGYIERILDSSLKSARVFDKLKE